MSDETDIPAMAETLRKKLAHVHGARGKTLTRALKHAGRALPRGVRTQVEKIIAAEHLQGNPRLALTTDTRAVRAAYREVVDHLDGIDVAGRRKTRALRMLGLVVCQVAVIVLIFVAVLNWRGFI